MNWEKTKERIEQLDPHRCHDVETAVCLKMLVEYIDKYVWRVPDSSSLFRGSGETANEKQNC